MVGLSMRQESIGLFRFPATGWWRSPSQPTSGGNQQTLAAIVANAVDICDVGP